MIVVFGFGVVWFGLTLVLGLVFRLVWHRVNSEASKFMSQVT